MLPFAEWAQVFCAHFLRIIDLPVFYTKEVGIFSLSFKNR